MADGFARKRRGHRLMLATGWRIRSRLTGWHTCCTRCWVVHCCALYSVTTVCGEGRVCSLHVGPGTDATTERHGMYASFSDQATVVRGLTSLVRLWRPAGRQIVTTNCNNGELSETARRRLPITECISGSVYTGAYFHRLIWVQIDRHPPLIVQCPSSLCWLFCLRNRTWNCANFTPYRLHSLVSTPNPSDCSDTHNNAHSESDNRKKTTEKSCLALWCWLLLYRYSYIKHLVPARPG